MPRLTPEERLEKARQAEAKAKERARQAAADIKKKERSLDTRRKIVLGAALLEAAERNPTTARFIENIVARLDRPHDRAAFENFELPKPPEKS